MDEKKENRAEIRRDLVRSLSMVFQLGLSAICPILILILVGLKLDTRFGNGHHWFTIAGAVCGVYAAYRSTYLLIRDGWAKDQAEQAERSETAEKTDPAEEEETDE